ncbi:ATP-grasp domain-containing protein [Candidatus Peregrinibacteria bacterium]|nr:ATP-grasp domain-containing protein [Candidatus Peregrinibacteria bacterium]
MRKINFDLAGLDLIIDKNGKIWFIEANSFPGFFAEQFNDKKDHISKTLGENLIAVLPSGLELSERYINLIKSLTNFHIEYVENDNLPNLKTDPPRTKVIAWKSKWKPILEKNNYIINSSEISALTSDKFKNYEAISSAKINTPKTILAKSPQDIKKFIKENNFKQIILKPRYGFRGEDISIIGNQDLKSFKIDLDKKEYIAQEFIEVDSKNALYKDYRILVAQNKYCGGIMRESHRPVVNISLGGELKQIPNSLNEQFQPISEKIVNTLINSSRFL